MVAGATPLAGGHTDLMDCHVDLCATDLRSAGTVTAQLRRTQCD